MPLLRTLTATALLLAACAGLAPSAAAAAPPPREYGLVQLNLCLSGLAGCFPRTAYPAVLDEAEAVVRAERPYAVTVNEGCSLDVAGLARRTGYRAVFATVLYRGAPLECTRPTGRGVFGNAVLVRGAVRAVQDAPFRAQAGVEERRLTCVTTDGGVRVCTAHLSTAGTPEAAAANLGQCLELAQVLAAGGPTAFAGDVNRQAPCAPAGWSVERDDEATQAPGIQHAYGSPQFTQPRSAVVPMARTDHDALVVRGWLRR